MVGLMACTSSVPQSNANDPIVRKVDSLLSIMTLEEKVGQTNLYNGTWEFTGPVPVDDNSQEKAENIKNGLVGAMLNVLTAEGTREAQKLAVENSRLGIPLMFGYDVIHGYKTMMPIPLAQAASWDYEVAKLGAQVAARESAAAGLHWTFAPMIDISRDARWGRIMESPGEDTYLATVLTKAWVEGFQGDDLSDIGTIAACAKHFAAYGFAEGGRDYNTVDISNHTLYNVVLPPFKAAAEAGVASFMNAFNEIGGIPATGHVKLQRDLLKGAWGYDGFVVSDWGSIAEMMVHGYAADSADAGLKAMIAGSDMDMESKIYEQETADLIKSGKLDERVLDDAVRRILTIKYQLGLFDDPYRYCDAQREKEEVLSNENLQSAREAAKKTLVLLKNEANLLPLSKSVGSIAVIGQLANSKDVPLGSWRARAITDSGVSLLEGIQNAVRASTKVRFSQGYLITDGERSFTKETHWAAKDDSGFREAIELSRRSEVVVLALGEDCFQSGEGRSQVDIGLKGSQLELYKEIIKVNKQVVVVLMNGRPLAIPEVADSAPAILETWFAGSEAGNAIADVLFGDHNPSAKLPVSFPYNVGQEPHYYNIKNTGRPTKSETQPELVFWSHYADSPKSSVFPFGYGLSYTTFEYSDLNVKRSTNGIKATVQLANTGSVAGEEVAQLYIHDVAASFTRPVKELKGFKKVALASGESTTLTFELSEEDLSFYTDQGELVFEPGEFEIWIGGSSMADLKAMIVL